MSDAPVPQPARIAAIACDVMRDEVEKLAPGIRGLASVDFFEMGLHDTPPRLQSMLQAKVDELNGREGIDGIAVVYGLCGQGIVGLQTSRLPMAAPRAHDCITLFLGSRHRYAGMHKEKPGSYFYTPGWNRERRVPSPEKIEMLKKRYAEQFDEDEAEFLIETEMEQYGHYQRACFIDTEVAVTEREACYTQGCAKWLGWQYERIKGDLSLIRDLMGGRWDAERFLILEPGVKIAIDSGDAIIKAAPAEDSP